MQESVSLDLRNEIRLVFDDDAVVHATLGVAWYRLSWRAMGKTIITNVPLAYEDIRWVGVVKRRQWWLLVPGVAFTLLGLLWTVTSFGDWGPFAVAVFWLLLFGVWPLILFVRGRPYLGIASDSQIILVPMDRKKAKIGRILGLLRQFCSEEALQWDLRQTQFADPELWDARPPTHRGFNDARYRAISAVLSLWGVARLCKYYIPKDSWSTAAPFVLGGILAIAVLALWRTRQR